MKQRLLAAAALGEAATGLILLIYPPMVIKLLFGANIARPEVVLSRIVGIALMGLAVACSPSRVAQSQAVAGMLTYSGLAMLYLLYIGISGELIGLLLWPAVVVHAILTMLLPWVWFTDLHSQDSKEK